MHPTPPRPLVVLYTWTTYLQPSEHRRRYGEEQVRLFEQLWFDERPQGRLARAWWLALLMAKSVWAANGTRLDGWRGAFSISDGGGRMGSDLRFTLRSVTGSWWYGMAVVSVVTVTMALATTAFAIVDGVLFRPLQYPNADRLVQLQPDFIDIGQPPVKLGSLISAAGASETDLRNWQAAVPSVPMTGFRAQPWSGLGSSVNDSAAGVASIQPNFFDVIGVSPLIGGFQPQDFLDSPRVKPVLATYDVWHSRFDGAADVVGRELITDRAGGYGFRIVGVMPKGFVFPTTMADVHFITPLVNPPASRQDPRARVLVGVIARLPDGMTPAVLKERLIPGLNATAAQFPKLGPKPEGWSETGWRRQGPFTAVGIASLSESLARRAGPLFRAVFAAVLFLVAIAGVNVSSLMTARALERQSEIAVRRSLGAGPRAIARLWVLEAGTLLAIGGLLGAAIAPLLIDLITQLLPDSVVLLTRATVDWRVVGFVAGTLVLMSALVAVAPIRRSLQCGVVAGPTTQARSASERVRTPGRIAVISVQVGIAFVLTVVGSSLVGSLLAVYANDRPIRTNGVVAVKVMFQGPGATMDVSAERSARERAIRERLMRVPGVSVVASTAAQVLAGGGNMTWFMPPAGMKHPDNIDTWPVTEGFYDALEPKLVQGRLPSNEELRSAAPLIVVSELAARAYWPKTSALGETLTDIKTNERYVVVGVVKDVRWRSWDTESPVVYAPYALSRAPWLTVFLRTDANTGRVIADALRAIDERDPMTTVTVAATLDDLYRDSVSLRRFQSWLFGGFAAVALVVVGVGILGSLAMSTARRTKEVGIRCALGATPGSVTTLLVREQLSAVGLGLVLGGVVAAWAMDFVEGYLYQLTTTDSRIWGTAVMLILAMAAVGTLIPAIRASHADPLKALRMD